MVSGPSVVFKRHLEINAISLQYNKYEDATTCKTIIRYVANSLYLPCAEQDMSIRGEYYKEFIDHFYVKLTHSVFKQFENDVLVVFRLGDIKLLEDRLKNPQNFCYSTQKMKFSIKDFSCKCDQIRSFLQIWSDLPKKSLMENFIFVQ